MSRRKLIAIDLDGTLLNDEGRVSKVTEEVIAEVRKAGHKVVIATGRHTASALPIAEQLGLTDSIVTFNGALVMNLENKQVELAYSYFQNDVIKLTELVKEWGYGYITSTKNHHYIEPQFRSLLNLYSGRGAQVEEVVGDEEIGLPILKTSIVGNERKLNEIEPFVQQTIPHLRVVRSGEQSIDVMNSKASKGAALQWLANHYQVKREDTISFGNYFNDLSMLDFAGTGVAVANAPYQVQQKADLVTDSNEKDGVANFLEKHLLGSLYSHA